MGMSRASCGSLQEKALESMQRTLAITLAEMGEIEIDDKAEAFVAHRTYWSLLGGARRGGESLPSTTQQPLVLHAIPPTSYLLIKLISP